MKQKKKQALTTGEAAKYCGVNFRTVIRWIERGLLKAYQLPGRGDNRIEIKDFLAFLQENNMPIPEELRQYTKQVLIIGNDSQTSKSLQEMLHKQDFEVTVAKDGFQAGALLGGQTPALMILDLSTPVVNGYEVLEFVRNTEALSALKILVLTSGVQSENDKALSLGANDVLEKPLVEQAFARKLENLFGQTA